MPKDRLRRLVGALGLAAACATALWPPLGYGWDEYKQATRALDFKGQLLAGRFAKHIYEKRALWEYQSVHLEDLLDLPPDPNGAATATRVLGSRGRVVTELGRTAGLPAPTLTRSTPIVVRGAIVGQVETTMSLRPVVANVGLVALLGGLLALGVLYAFRVLPLRTLDRTLGALGAERQALREQNLRFDAALENMSQGLAMFDAQRRLVVCNARFLELFGLSPGAVGPGTSLSSAVAQAAAAGGGDGARKTLELVNALVADGRAESYSISARGGRSVVVSHRPMPDGGWVATYEDVTERERANARIAYLAHHDALTGLLNRVLFRERLVEQLAGLAPHDELAVLCLDLDQFKDVNDTLGHAVGDALLREVAIRLQDCVGSEAADYIGTVTIARMGGDEFALVHARPSQLKCASALAAHLVQALRRPFDLDGYQVEIGTSIGIALAPSNGVDPDRLLRCADLALYAAKADGRGTYRLFEPEMDASFQARRQLEADMRNTLSHRGFVLHYQPIVSLRTNAVVGFEALLRWQHPERGPISPAEFVPLAEATGLISPLGEWVLRQACEDAAAWPSQVRVSVNLSPLQFRDRSLVHMIAAALAATGLSPQRLELEITESVLLADDEATMATLHQIRGLGVRVVMDDFGIGYSSLSYLRSFPFDKIKLDQTFVRDVEIKADARAIVRAVTALSREIGMRITAEGVETEGQLTVLREEGCDEAQGYLFSPPRPAGELGCLLPGVVDAKATMKPAA